MEKYILYHHKLFRETQNVAAHTDYIENTYFQLKLSQFDYM